MISKHFYTHFLLENTFWVYKNAEIVRLPLLIGLLPNFRAQRCLIFISNPLKHLHLVTWFSCFYSTLLFDETFRSLYLYFSNLSILHEEKLEYHIECSEFSDSKVIVSSKRMSIANVVPVDCLISWKYGHRYGDKIGVRTSIYIIHVMNRRQNGTKEMYLINVPNEMQKTIDHWHKLSWCRSWFVPSFDWQKQ